MLKVFTNDCFSTSGVRYIKDQVTGQCITDAITNSTFDVGEKTSVIVNGSNIYALQMKDPMALFYLDSNYSYTGKVLDS